MQSPSSTILRWSKPWPLKPSIMKPNSFIFLRRRKFGMRQDQSSHGCSRMENLWGETYGIPLASSIAGLTDLTDSEKRSGIHCYSNTILPSFQKRGLGTILKAHWLGMAAGKGFESVYGYARPGGSQSLNARFGAVF